jgi:hypothetical protein
MDNLKPTRGGRRKGAGRPSLGRKSYTIKMKPTAHARLKSAAKPLAIGEWLEGVVQGKTRRPSARITRLLESAYKRGQDDAENSNEELRNQ